MAAKDSTAVRFVASVDRILEERGMTRAALAKAMGVTPPLISRMLRIDSGRVPKTDTLDDVAKALGLKVCELLCDSATSPAAKPKRKGK